MVRLADCDVGERLAVMVADVWVAAVGVETVKLAVVLPPATLTVVGTSAPALLEDRLTDRPVLGAGVPSVTRPAQVFPR